MSALKKLDALLAGKPLSRALAREILAEHRAEVLREAVDQVRASLIPSSNGEEEREAKEVILGIADLIDPDKGRS